MNDPLSSLLDQLIQDSRASEVGVAAHRLATGEEILIDADRPFHPASTIKVCIMLEVFHQAQLHAIALDDPIPIKNEFLSIVDSGPYSLDINDDSEKELYHHIGQSVSRRELVRRMITVSSNLATNILIEHVKLRQVNGFMRELGAEELIVLRGMEDKHAFRLGLNNSATARGLMKILLKLAKGDVVSPQASDEMIGILSEQQLNEMIPARLPVGVRVAHKTGWIADHYHDAGIVYPPSGEPFVLAVLTKGYAETDEEAAHAFVASLAKAVYDHWKPSD